MELKHYLQYGANRLEIGEPIGFDSMKTTIKRGEYHGMSAQVTVSSLEFYGEAAHFIKEAYNVDIDSNIIYQVIDELGTIFYSGSLDLSTLNEKQSEYYSVSVKVGETGVKTTFNNRTTTEVDIYSQKTIDGHVISSLYKHKIVIPNKEITYTNLIEAHEDIVWNASTSPTGRYSLFENRSNHWINFSLGEPTLNEFGSCSPKADIAKIRGWGEVSNEDDCREIPIKDYYDPMIDFGSDFASKFGDDTVCTLDINITVKVECPTGDFFPDKLTYGSDDYYDVKMVLVDRDAWSNMPWSNPEWTMLSSKNNTLSDYKTSTTLTLKGQTKTSGKGKGAKLFLGIALKNNYTKSYNDGTTIYFYAANNEREMKVTVLKGSYIRMTLSSNFKGTVHTKFVLVRNALNYVVKQISNNHIELKSSLLEFNPNKSIIGPMALLGLATGYDIRGFSDKGFNISFKDMIEALDALGCIGWSLEDEGNQTFVRVERWDYFYNNDVILEITDPNEISRQFDTENVISELTIGYKKYSTNEDLNSIDSIHAERVFNNQICSISKPVKKLCTFIADNYAIEETRRKSIEKASDEFKYDENIFVFELTLYGTSEFIVKTGVSNASNILDKRTTYNVRISPRRMAENWKSRMSLFNMNRNIRFVSGKVNYKTVCMPTRYHGSYEYLYSYYGGEDKTIAENADIEWTKPLFKAEIVKFKYPISRAQYQSIMDNPYGLIRVDGEDYWLKEMQYEVASGETEFKLIPKNQ